MLLRQETFVLLKHNLALEVKYYDHNTRRYMGSTVYGVMHSFTLWDVKEVISYNDFFH